MLHKDKSIKFKFSISEYKALHNHLIDAYDYIAKESRHIDDLVTIMCLEQIMVKFEKKFIDWEHKGLYDTVEKTLTFSWIDYIAILKSNCIEGEPFAENVLHKMMLEMPSEIAALLN